MDTYGFLLFFHLAIVSTTRDAIRNDFRYISYQDLQLAFDKFSQDGVTAYSQILFDVARHQVFVGARDSLFRLSLPKLELIENATWAAPEEKTVQCIQKGQYDESCHNYIKVLLTNGKKIFTCGTNAFSPQCSWRETGNISYVTEWIDGIAKCPYNPLANVTGLMSDNGEFYFGGSADFSASDYLISRSIGEHSTIRTKQYNSMWLNEPQFVGSFETNSFVYFLFREAAVEYINCGKIVYSRIARMCKNDGGGRTMLKDNWTTFVKARLNCSISGDYPFYFDEIQSTSYVPDENIVYATFTTPSNSIAGSAICAFNLTSIDAAFAGPFKYQEHARSTWNKHYSQYQDHFECKASPRSSHLLESSKYQLMDDAVQATTLSPLYVAELERFTYITIDVLSTKLHAAVHVIYVANLDGLIKKITVLPRTQETCIVEIWQPVPDSNVPILNMQFLKNANSLYIGTETGVLRIPADHCGRHVSRDSCLNAMDPYCGWNELDDACTTAPHSDPLVKHWKQSVTSCPVLDAPIDGGWSSWSDWNPCIHRTDTESSDTCMCQTRTCNNPAPQNDGRPCPGESIAVTNCTVHGGWTPWSAWSACSATCGLAVKTRTRTCTNPAPAHGGRVCVGQDHSEVVCAGNPPCPISTPVPQDGGWGEWKQWGPCSAPCGGGFRKRQRMCNNPFPKNGGQECVGCSVDFDICNTHQCPEQRKQGAWTPWLVYNNATNNEYIEKRYKFTCRGPVQDQQQLKISTKEEIRTCKDGFCSSAGIEEPARWTTWSTWSECSVPCGGGYQNKTRYCEGRGECQGASIQTKACNAHPCHDEWGCWSDWSPCSATCGWGIRTRYRKCLGHKCVGSERDEEPCESAPCNSLLGWDKWSAWSLCDENNEQFRKRKCRTSKPNPQMCQGQNVESRMCIRVSDGENDMPLTDAASVTPGVIVAASLSGFLLGFPCACLMIFFYLKKKKTSIPSSPHYMSAKQNPYITVPLHDRPAKKQCASTSNNILNNFHNGTLKSKCYDYDTATIKRNSHSLNNGHSKQDDDKLFG